MLNYLWRFMDFLTDSTSIINGTNEQHNTSSIAYTLTQTPPLSTLPASLALSLSSSTSSYIPRVTTTPSSSKDATPFSSMSSSVVSNSTDTKRRPRRRVPSGAKLSSFGIVMVALAGILVTVMVVCLLVICCRGRERGYVVSDITTKQVGMGVGLWKRNRRDIEEAGLERA